MEFNGLIAVIAAVWGGIWTLNSAISAFLQTKWMYDQRQLLRKMSATLDSIRDLHSIQVGDDIQKSDNCDPFGDLQPIDGVSDSDFKRILEGDSLGEQYTCGCDDEDCPYCNDEEEIK